ncbi:PHD finger protein 7-like [Sitodiplosis mosellana]|uniref:PHD finger protein 7-like n=1 Tax=Sitodiplosis mosellana TaxID=263140 RepID=UPI00244410CA|nr:PHD finger protein 7-like [Sitodiplosis mosellana]
MDASTGANICCICRKSDTDDLAYGKWESIRGYKAHQFCLLLLTKSRGIDDVIENGEIQLKEFDTSICYVCNEKNATVFCSAKNCQRAFHVVCGEKKHCLMKYVEPYDAYCDEHHGILEIPPASWECQACWESFGQPEHENNRSPVDFIPSCCRHGWYHRRCIRKQAHFSGDNMKCPSCGAMGDDRATFQRFVQTRGVFIPKRSALYPLHLDEKKKNLAEKERSL